MRDMRVPRTSMRSSAKRKFDIIGQSDLNKAAKKSRIKADEEVSFHVLHPKCVSLLLQVAYCIPSVLQTL